MRQFTPVYWATTNSPLVTTGPEPLIRVLDTSAVGGVTPLGIVTLGALPWAALTVGRSPPPLDTLVPDADTVPDGYFWIRSMTNTSVSLPVTPSWEFPLVP